MAGVFYCPGMRQIQMQKIIVGQGVDLDALPDALTGGPDGTYDKKVATGYQGLWGNFHIRRKCLMEDAECKKLNSLDCFGIPLTEPRHRLSPS